MIIGVPSGIGDVSWMYSKLMHIEEPLEIEIADGWPYRTVPFMQLLPKVTHAAYGPFRYEDILSFESVQGINGSSTWESLRRRGYGKLLIEANRHLEAGKRLEEWLPDLPCEFHYEIRTSELDAARAAKLIEGMTRPIIGISAASYRGSEAWKTWSYAQWSDLLKRLQAETHGSILLMGGFWDDLTSTLSDDGYKDVVGKTSVGSAVELLRLLDGYVGFSSGLGVLRTVLRKPVFMLWPWHQLELSTSWAPPEMLDSGEYVVSMWIEPELVWKRMKPWLRLLA